ncbi:JmjC domain-containing protein [Pseudonocardia spinosispora]|uniref:JmjC domain-containing protein n=1 Tax=Pseudonocardia spinosispora TaxID=103441 RepID=UPI000410E1DF|nr:cupin domain-containing protein [Pseudonocardia spinosispora]
MAALFTERFVELAGGDFAAERLGNDFVRVSSGDSGVADLLTWQALNELLSTRQLSAPRLRLFREGTQVPVANYTREDPTTGRQALVPDELYRELRDGASLVLDSIDQLHPPIARAADDLMRLVREPVQVNLYLVWGGRQGFDTHWDDHDTMIVQLAGSKHWTVRGQGRRFPMKVDNDHDHQPPDTMLWEGDLAPGDIIHVPRGWWHAVRGTGELSMHLTFGFTRRTGIDWANWIVEQLYAEELFRQDLPRFAAEGPSEQHADELVTALTKIIEANRPADFLATRDRRFPRRSEINLPLPVSFEMPADDAVLEITALLDPVLDEAPDVTRLTVAGKTYRFAPVMAPMLRHLVTERTTTVARLRTETGLADKTLSGALELLLQQHLVVVRSS